MSASLNGDRAVVGALGEPLTIGDAGSAYIFERNAGGTNGWGEVKRIVGSDTTDFDKFGARVSLNGDTVIVGAPYANGSPGQDTGAAYIFDRDHGGLGNWGEVARLHDPTNDAEDHFGFGVALSGDVAVVGAENDRVGGIRQGAAYIYERDAGGPNNWGLVTELTAPDGEATDAFGISVALHDDTVVVGAAYADTAGLDSGALYVFERDNGGPDKWGLVRKLLALDAESGDFLGDRVAISGDTLLAGAEGRNLDMGVAYIFGRNQGGADNWGQVKQLVSSDAAQHVAFGGAVAVADHTAVVGTVSGRVAYTFQGDAGGMDNWGEVARMTPNDAGGGGLFGISVTIADDTVIIGAPGDGDGGDRAGAAYVFDSSAKPTLTPTFTPTVTPRPVGGVSFDTEARGRPRLPLATWLWLLPVVLAAVALGGAALYARRVVRR